MKNFISYLWRKLPKCHCFTYNKMRHFRKYYGVRMHYITIGGVKHDIFSFEVE